MQEEAACGASIPGHLQLARAVPRVSCGCAWLAVADGRDTQDLKRADEQVRISARLLPGNATLGGFCSPQSVSPRRRCYLRRDVILVYSMHAQYKCTWCSGVCVSILRKSSIPSIKVERAVGAFGAKTKQLKQNTYKILETFPNN